MKITKNRYLAAFAIVVFLLAMVRLIFPSVAENREGESGHRGYEDTEVRGGENSNRGDVGMEVRLDENSNRGDESTEILGGENSHRRDEGADSTHSRFFDADGNPVKHRILSVASYSEAFPDSQQVQYASAMEWGVGSVANRQEAENRKRELVFVGASPYYHVDKMYRSIPYLVPRAAVLLNDIGRAYYDSLQLKGVPLHQFIVTSVLRTKEDVAKLRNYNGNATENSCHLYGTTFDICYNRYKTVCPPGEKRRQVQNDTLKWVLCEVLRDMRQQKRCHIKYEVKQGCFHITVR